MSNLDRLECFKNEGYTFRLDYDSHKGCENWKVKYPCERQYCGHAKDRACLRYLIKVDNDNTGWCAYTDRFKKPEFNFVLSVDPKLFIL